MKFRYEKDTEELVVSESTRIEYHQINLWLTRKIKGWRFHPAVKMNVWDGNKTFFRNGRINLGLWKECAKACNEIGVKFVLENKEDFPLNRDITLEKVDEFCKSFFKDHKIKNKEGEWIPFYPFDHQILSAYKILKNKFCLAEVATSGGKTLIIAIVYFYILSNMDKDAKILFIVPSISLVTQAYDAFIDFNIGLNKEFDGGNKSPLDIKIEEVMSDRPRKHMNNENPNIYIGTYQSLEKYPKEFFKQFQIVCVDEGHMAKAKTINSILEKTFVNAQYRFGVSGTFPVEESCEILSIQSVLGPIITEVSATELMGKDIITPMNIKAVVLNHATGEMNDRLNYIKKMGGGADAFRYEKDFIQNSDKRLEFIKKLVDKCDTNTLLLFHTIEYGTKIFNKLKEELPDKDFYYIDGEVNNKQREIIKKEMEKTDGKVKVLIASYGTLSTGVSINAIFNVIFADSFKSEQIIIQSIGRALRKHDQKKIATIFDIVDVFDPKELNNILYKHFLEREKFYKKRKYPYKVIKMNL